MKLKLLESKEGKKLIYIFAFLFFLVLIFIFLYFSSFPRFITPKAILLKNETILFPEIQGKNCSLFVTGPTGEMSFFGDFDCSDYVITKTEIKQYFNNRSGIYKILVVADNNKSYIKTFVVS
jgi:hypothetical protein